MDDGGLQILLDVLRSNPTTPEVLERLVRVLNTVAQSDPSSAAMIAQVYYFILIVGCGRCV